MSDHANGRERWLAVRVRARHEKVVARALAGLGLPCLLPLRGEAREYAGVTVHVELPVVTGCVFVRGGETVAFQAAMVPGVCEVTDVDPRTLAPLPPGIRATLLNGELGAGKATRPPDQTPSIFDGRG